MRACDRSRWPCLARSMSRPGVPTTTSTPRLQRLDLRLVGAAAVDGEHADAALACRPARGRRRPGRRARGSGRRPGPAACRRDGMLVEAVVAGGDDAVEHRDAEAEGLAGAGLGLADDVVAGQGDRQGHRLDGERGGDAVLGERVDDVGVDAKSAKEATGGGSVTVAAAVSASSASALRSSLVVVASVTSVMGLFRSAGARAPAQGLWADRRSSVGGLRRGRRALATSRN